jgi:predicted DNA-binding transcriptional regulator AlpA
MNRSTNRPVASSHSSDLPRVIPSHFLVELDVSKSTFFRWKALGQAPKTYKLPNGHLRIRRTDFDAWLSSREEPQAA